MISHFRFPAPRFALPISYGNMRYHENALLSFRINTDAEDLTSLTFSPARLPRGRAAAGNWQRTNQFLDFQGEPQ